MGLLELAATGGINVGFLVGILGLLQIVKKIDTKKQLGSGFYLIAVVVFGLLVGIVTGEGGFMGRTINGIAHAGVASLIYQYANKLIPQKNKIGRNDKFVIIKKKE